MSPLSSDDWLVLLGTARRAILAVVIENSLPDFPPFPENLSVRRGVFVSLYRQGKLRGCVGHIDHPDPLAEGVARAAINAALHDPRFPPVTSDEIADLEIEISILSPMEIVAPDAIVAGLHGVLVVRPPHRGILLPQVARERQWSSELLLEETCAKAGLPRNAWQEPNTKIFGFTAEVFSEAEFRTIRRA